MSLPNLDGARAVIAANLPDQCSIVYDAQGVADDELDPDTLELTRPAGDDAAIYTGACLLTPLGATEEDRGGQQVQGTGYLVALPFDAALPPVGAMLTVTAVGPLGDPALVDTEMRITRVPRRSLFVFRELTAYVVEPVPQ